MRTIPNHLIAGAAGVIFLAGLAYAGNLYLNQGSVKTPNTREMLVMEDALQNAPKVDTGTLTDSGPTAPAPVVAPPKKVEAPPPAPPAPVKVIRTVAPPVVRSSRPRIDPLSTIALVGVTHEGGHDTAWLIDLNPPGDRVTASVGERAFGLTVSDIQPESVVLTNGTDKYTLRLGEKQIQGMTVASTEPGASALDPLDGGDDPMAAMAAMFRGRGQRGQRGGGRGGNGYGGGRGGRGGGGFGGFGGGVFNFGGNNNRGGAGAAIFRAAASGAFGGGGGSGGTSATTALSPSANAQQSRRTGAALESGVTAMSPLPAALQNPQTFRRNGTNSGPAFGNAPATPASGSSATTASRQGLGYGQGVQ